jgi:hypothetical protein
MESVVPACSGVRFGGDLAGGLALGLALCLCAPVRLCLWGVQCFLVAVIGGGANNNLLSN